MLLNNFEYYSNKNIIDFLNDIGRHYRIGNLLKKETI